jgi:DnaK suppressor protein
LGKKAGVAIIPEKCRKQEMDQKDRSAIKSQILSEIEKVKGDIVSLGQQTGPVKPDAAIGRLTRMEAISSRGISAAKLRDAKGRLIMLENARGKIDDPDFGNCRECGDPIQIARLKLLPETTLCIECAEAG